MGCRCSRTETKVAPEVGVGDIFHDDEAVVPLDDPWTPHMYVLPMPRVLSLQRLEPRHALVKHGLVAYRSEHLRKVIFVSHQWLGWEHPDPDGEHCRALKCILARLMEGGVEQTEAHWSQQGEPGAPESVPGSAWAAALPHMFCCWDFLALPELGCKARVGAGTSLLKQKTTDPFRGDASRSMCALPEYVERAALLLVLAPVCRHCDSGEWCNLATWRERRWCRTELAVCMLARTRVRVLVCPGVGTAPYLSAPDHALAFPVGAGKLPCCELRACCGPPGSGGRACESHVLRAVLEVMVSAKDSYLKLNGRRDEQRTLAGLRKYLLREASSQSPSPDAFASEELLKSRTLTLQSPVPSEYADLQWLLPFAAMGDDAETVRDLLVADDCRPDEPLWEGNGFLGLPREMTPLMLAMRFAGFEVCAALLDALADPAHEVAGVGALMCAAVAAEQERCVRGWLARFPRWHLGRREVRSGRAALHMAAGCGPGKAGVVRLLLAARADPRAADDMGALPLHAAAAKADSDPGAVELLVAACPETVAARVVARGPWRARCRAVRRALLFRPSTSVQHAFAAWDGSTALHLAAARGDVAVARVLLGARASLQAKNAQGLTPVQVARLGFGSQVASALRHAFEEKVTEGAACGDISGPGVGARSGAARGVGAGSWAKAGAGAGAGADALLREIAAPALEECDPAPPERSPAHLRGVGLLEAELSLASVRPPGATEEAPRGEDAPPAPRHPDDSSAAVPEEELQKNAMAMTPSTHAAPLTDTFGDTLLTKAGNDMVYDAYEQDAPLPKHLASSFSCTRGALGVTALALDDRFSVVQPGWDYAADGGAARASGRAAAEAVEGETLKWLRGPELGCGSLGRVVSGLDQQTGQMIAVKEVMIEESLEADVSFREALEQEVAVLQHLKHPSIVSYLGHDRIDGCLYIYLEHMAGGSMAGVLTQFGPFEESLIAVYTRELLEGLEYLHTRHPPVVHRDIKGANVLVGTNCKVKLSDFGCSKRSPDTLSWTMRGSIPWMAPEVITHAGYGRPADIWSFGCVLIEMATATRPWGKFDNPMAAMVKIGMTEDTPPSPEGLSPACLEFLDSCLRREPLLRLSAAELLAHPFVAALHESAPERRGNQEFLDMPDYTTLKELLPHYLD